MADIGDLKNTIAGILGTTPTAFVQNGIDLLLLALNNARRTAELAHDFYYSQTNLTLSIGSSGASILNSVGSAGSGIQAAGTLSPDITVGVFTIAGEYNGESFYTQLISSILYALFFNGTAWIISASGLTPTNYWSLTSANPIGTYTAHGSFTGTPVLTGQSQFVGIKRIQNVLLPLTTGDLVPIEFLTNDDWISRILRLNGRQPWNPGLTSYQLGISANNPTCYQQGQSLFLVPPSQFHFPITATLSVVQWMPDYVANNDTDYFTMYGPEFLQWQGIIEGNKLLQTFVQRREGNLDETNLQAEAQEALQALIAWDVTISNGTSTPYVPPAPQPAAA